MVSNAGSNLDAKKILLVIVGPTASGKTALAIRLSQIYKAPILSADARQFYREMTIGTAKPTPEELLAAPHYFINTKSIHENYDAASFAEDALGVLENIFQTHTVAILVGGSGMYVQALCEGFDEMPAIDPAIRQKWNERWKENGVDFLAEELKAKDPVYYETVDRKNPQRLIRALEVIEGTGRPFSAFRQKKTKQRPFSTLKIGLEWPREELYARIDQRMDDMLANGLWQEAESLFPYKNLNALHTVGYSEIFDFLEGKTDKETCIRLLKQNSRRYAKRQMTWFKRDPEIHWFLPQQSEEIELFVSQTLHTEGLT